MSERVKLAYASNGFTRFSLLEAIRAVGELGYDGIEILADTPHWYPKAPGREAAAITRELDRAGLGVSNVNANCTFGYWKNPPPEPFFEPSLVSPRAALRRDRIRLILHTLEFARRVGAKNISITSGKALPEMPPETALRQLRESLKPILDRAESLNVDVGIECEPLLLVEWAEELCSLIAEVGSHRLGANLDLGHSIVLGEKPSQVLQMLRGRIWNCHIEDLPGRKHYHLIPGTGSVDFRAIARAMQRTGYNRYATVELYTCTADPHGAARQSLSALKSIFGLKNSDQTPAAMGLTTGARTS
jgi:sugar phosphate isomerase/epimerase